MTKLDRRGKLYHAYFIKNSYFTYKVSMKLRKYAECQLHSDVTSSGTLISSISPCTIAMGIISLPA